MKIRHLLLATLVASLSAAPAHAQFNGLLDALKSEATDVLVDSIGARPATAEPAGAGSQSASPRLRINQGFDFTPGAHVVVSTDFGDAAMGTMPRTWKTNGSGQVVSADGLAGEWLSLQPFATYKLATAPNLPERFTVEFDIVPVGDKLRDARGVTFGFAHDNSVREYLSDAYNGGAINAADLNFAGSSSVASSATGTSHFIDLDLDGYINRPMHISIAVDGDRGRVYVGNNKIADARLFDGDRAKYFFVSAPTQFEHGAGLLFSNFRIATFE